MNRESSREIVPTSIQVEQVNKHYGIKEKDLRSLMEAAKTHLGWSELYAMISSSDEMYFGLWNKMNSGK